MSATPILDGQQPLPEGKKKRRWLPRLVGLIIGVLFLWWTETGAPADTVSSMTLLFPLAVILAIYVAILVNLLGHLIAGMAAGFEIRSLALVGFFVDKQATRWRLRFVPRRIFAAFLHMTPVSTENLARRYAWFMAGGPAATIALLLFTLLALPKGEFEEALLFASLAMAAYCCIPYTSRGISSPAKRLMILAGKGVEAERLAAIMYLMAIDAQGTRPSAWPRELLEKIGVPGKATPFSATSLALTYMVVRDSNDPEAIADALEKALALIDEMPPDTRRWVACLGCLLPRLFSKSAVRSRGVAGIRPQGEAHGLKREGLGQRGRRLDRPSQRGRGSVQGIADTLPGVCGSAATALVRYVGGAARPDHDSPADGSGSVTPIPSRDSHGAVTPDRDPPEPDVPTRLLPFEPARSRRAWPKPVRNTHPPIPSSNRPSDPRPSPASLRHRLHELP